MSVVYEIICEDLDSFNCDYLNLKFSLQNLFTESLIIAIISIHLKKIKCATKKPRANWWPFFSKDLEINDRKQEARQIV
jgi:hypothetical protein